MTALPYGAVGEVAAIGAATSKAEADWLLGDMLLLSMGQGKTFRESLKVLEADIQHANTISSELPRAAGDACIQMRLSYSPIAQLFMFLVRWADCSLAGALGLMRILIFKVYVDGTTTMGTQERKASLHQFYAYIYPSLQQLQGGVTEYEAAKQRAACAERYTRRAQEERARMTALEREVEHECGLHGGPRRARPQGGPARLQPRDVHQVLPRLARALAVVPLLPR